ncbi:hypothetical protein KBB49_02030, partial [Candidatus Saccharibacteria bacterium]|nr:hypothetical protein [Candidatus Saccharibacteria bacterium]
TVDLSVYLDDTDTDTQDLSLGGNTLSLVAGGSVDLSGYLDNTDAQDLTLSVNTLSLSGDGTTVDLSSYLDNTDNQNLFFTINVDNGTDPVADSATDTLNWVSGTGVTITGDGTTDTITVASVLGTTIETGEITNDTILGEDIFDGTILNADLANSALTITAGNGLTTGGSVALGASVTVNVGAGTGITVNANDIAITADGLNFTELSDTLTLDATTTISLGASNLTTNLDSTGDYAIQFGGNTVFSIIETGAVAIGNILSDQTIGIDNGTGAINISTDSDANSTSIGTGTGADTVTIGDANANVALTDAQWSISGAGAASFASINGAGLADCDQNDDTLKWDSATGLFSCGTNRASFHNVLDGNYTNATLTFSEVDNNADATDDIGFPIGANETWVFESSNQLASNATADSKWQVTAPAGATCDISVSNIEQAISVSNLACTTSTGNIAVGTTDTNEVTVSGVVSTGATAGNVIVNFGQNAASGTSTIFAGSFITAYRVSGADYAEIYYSEDRMSKGMIAEFSGNGPSQIKTANSPYSDRLVGIYSTQPGNVIGEADGNGLPVPIALSGRVPILLSTENGIPKAGDMITSSATIPGYGMLAKKSGYIVGQLMVDSVDNGDGTAQGFVYVRHGYWQAPITIDLSSIIGQNATTQLSGSTGEELGINGITALQYNSLDQDAVNEILRGFTVQQEQINVLSARVDTIEQQSNLDSTGLLSLLNFDNDAVSFLSDVTFNRSAYFNGTAVFNNDTVGTISIPPGETSFEVQFAQSLNYKPSVSLTPNSFINSSWRTTNVSDSGFVVELLEPQESESNFSWQVIQTR